MTKLHNELGRTMLEMLGVLAIMGVIMYGAIAGIGFGVDMYKINATYNDLEELSQGVIDLYSWKQDYSVSATQIWTALRDNNILDDNNRFNAVDHSIDGRFGGSRIQIASVLNGSHFDISLMAIPYIACVRLADMTYANMRAKTDNNTKDGCGNNLCDGDGPYTLCLRSR